MRGLTSVLAMKPRWAFGSVLVTALGPTAMPRAEVTSKSTIIANAFFDEIAGLQEIASCDRAL